MAISSDTVVVAPQKPRIGPWTLTRQILREHGIRGMFVGLSSTIAREMPGYFFFFGGYEATRELLAAKGQKRDDIGWQKTMVAGAVGGSMLWLAIFPADVVKSRVQVRLRSVFIMIYNAEKALCVKAERLKRCVCFSIFFVYCNKMFVSFGSGAELENTSLDSFQGYHTARRYRRAV